MRRVVYGLGLWLTSCGSGNTELIVTLDSELVAPGDIDTFEVDVMAGNGARRTVRKPLVGPNATSLPYVFGIENALGDPEEVVVTVTGLALDNERIERRVRVSFVSDRRIELAVTLERSCLDVLDCGEGLTCREGGCASDVARDAELVELGVE